MKSNLSKLLVAAASSVFATGCATVDNPIDRGDAKLIPGTVSVRPAGRNYEISGLIEANGRRKEVFVYHTDCHDGRGMIFFRNFSDGSAINNAMLNGASPADQLFAQLCSAGRPTSNRMMAESARREAAKTPEQRADEQRAAAESETKLLQMLLLQEQNQSRERAAREIGNSIRDGRQSTTNCESTVMGTVSCRTR